MMDGRPLEDHPGQTRRSGQPAVPDMAPSAKDDDGGLPIGQIIGMLWQGKFWLAFFMLVGIVAATFHYANTRPVFQADALLQLEEKSGALSLPGNLTNMLENDARTSTEVEILRSRMVLGQAVADMNLD